MTPGIDWEKWYVALRAVEPDAYKAAIEYAEGLSLNYNFSLMVAAEVERSHVMLACRVLRVQP